MEHVSVLIFEHVCCSLVALPCHSFFDSLAFRLCFDEFCTSLWLLLLLLVCGCLCCFLFVSLAFRLCRHSKKPCFGNCDPYKWQQQHSVCSRCVTIAEINKRYNARAFGKCRLVKYLTASSHTHAPSFTVCSWLLHKMKLKFISMWWCMQCKQSIMIFFLCDDWRWQLLCWWSTPLFD